MASSCDVSDPFASTDSWTHQATTLPRTTTTPWRTPAGNLGRSETSPPRAVSPALPQWEALLRGTSRGWQRPSCAHSLKFLCLPRVPYLAVARTFEKIEEVSAR